MPASDVWEGLPIPTPPELLAEVAQLAPHLHLDAASGWLRGVFAAVSPTDLAAVLSHRGAATRARAGYLADTLDNPAHATAIADLDQIGRGPDYTGPRTTAAPFDSRWHVYGSGRIVR